MGPDTPPTASGYVQQDLSTLTKARTIPREPRRVAPSTGHGKTSSRLSDAQLVSEIPRSSSTSSIVTPGKRLTSPPPVNDPDRTARPLTRRISASGTAPPVDALLAQKDAEIGALRAKLQAAEVEVRELRSTRAVSNSSSAKGAGAALAGQDLKELERQFAAQEALLNGYQRENERSVTELEALRKVKRDMEVHLHRLYGAEWEAEVSRTAGGPPLARMAAAAASPSLHNRSASLNSPLRSTPLSPLAKEAASFDAFPPLDPTKALPAGLDAPTLLAHLESVRALVGGMERRILERAADLETREAGVRLEAKAALLAAA